MTVLLFLFAYIKIICIRNWLIFLRYRNIGWMAAMSTEWQNPQAWSDLEILVISISWNLRNFIFLNFGNFIFILSEKIDLIKNSQYIDNRSHMQRYNQTESGPVDKLLSLRKNISNLTPEDDRFCKGWDKNNTGCRV